MKILAVIEIPKGNDQRWRLNFEKTKIENFGPIKDRIPVNGGKMPAAYGYLDATENKDEGMNENVDVIVFSTKEFEIGTKVFVQPFGIMYRADKDEKILATDDTMTLDDWMDIPETERRLVMEFFGYNSPIESIESKTAAEEYIIKSFIK